MVGHDTRGVFISLIQKYRSVGLCVVGSALQCCGHFMRFVVSWYDVITTFILLSISKNARSGFILDKVHNFISKNKLVVYLVVKWHIDIDF